MTIGNSKVLYSLKNLLVDQRPRPVNKGDDLCIEGFQRSGNGFFLRLMRELNKGIRISHHNHAPQNALKSIKLGIPTVVLIRKPEECVASLMTYDPRFSIANGLYCYKRFYTTLMPFRKKMVIAEFSELIQNPDTVIDQINQKFGISFQLSHLSPDALKAYVNAKGKKNPFDSPLYSDYPNSLKASVNESNKARVILHPRLTACHEVYRKFIEPVSEGY